MSKLILIPPFSMASNYPDERMYLYLPQLMSDHRYLEFVAKTNTENSYTILDNGAYEDQLFDTKAFLGMVHTVDPNEIVIPDVLGDAKGTLAKLYEFSQHDLPQDANYMMVAQGKTVNEIWDMIVVAVAQHPFIKTIGLPKHLVVTVDQRARVVLCNRIKALYGDRFDIHFLGSSPAWPKEILYVHDAVRSMDTSMPFAFAWHGLNIGHPGVEDGGRPDAERPDDYFNVLTVEFNGVLLNKNIAKMRAWSNGEG